MSLGSGFCEPAAVAVSSFPITVRYWGNLNLMASSDLRVVYVVNP